MSGPSRFVISINPNLREQIFQEAFQETMVLLGVEFTKSITDNIWAWPTGGSRDIVDSGRLRDAQQLTVVNASNVEFSWNTDYAAAVHEGATFRNGYQLTARPWIWHTISNYDVMATFRRIYDQKVGP